MGALASAEAALTAAQDNLAQLNRVVLRNGNSTANQNALKVAKEDLGKVIGKQGRTARAIRTILNGASTKLKKRTVLEIIE